MSQGNQLYRKGPLPNQSFAPVYVPPQAERDLARFTDIDVWMQPDQANVLATEPHLHVFSRVNGYDIRSAGPDISVGTGLTGAKQVINFAGGSPAGQTPLVVENFKLGGSYFVGGIFTIDANANMNNAQTFCSVGVNNTPTSLSLFQQQGILRVRHGSNDHASVSEFVAGGTYMINACYDADADDIKAYINSLTPVTWETSNATGAVGGDLDLRIGSQWNTSQTNVINMLDGTCRAAWAGRAPWGRSDYDATRNNFMTRMAAIYAADIPFV